jgi:hypothetical protein
MVRLAMYRAKGTIFNAGIRLWTGSIYSHCEIVVDGWCYSSSVMDKGVRRKQIDINSGNWDLIDLPWADADYVRRYLDKTDRQAYGWMSLITSQLFNLGLSGERSQFCSEWCANALRVPNPSAYSPQTLLELCSFISKTLAA